ncbi:MAG: hypothetical protein HMLKMBBP_02659 [Planctomycetes bacterium]|nr:hypothetical protein [Planctomycetota bacterium]
MPSFRSVPARSARSFVAQPFVTLTLAAALAAAGCASGGGSAASGGGDGGAAAAAESGPRVSGDVTVTLRTTPASGAATDMALVNASSALGKRLASGRESSTVVRVVSDVEMATLLRELDKAGFSSVARDGVSVSGLRDDMARRGVIVVEQDGRSRGFEFRTGMGESRVPSVYVDCKRLIWGVHMQVPAYEAKVTVGEAPDADRVFQSPPARLKR